MTTSSNTSPEAWCEAAMAYSQAGHQMEAISACDRALQIDPAYAKAYVLKGFALNALEQYEEAISAYDHTLEIDPIWPSVISAKGDVLYRLGRYKEALVAFDHSLKLAPNNVNAWINIAMIYRALGNVREAKAAELQAQKLGG